MQKEPPKPFSELIRQRIAPPTLEPSASPEMEQDVEGELKSARAKLAFGEECWLYWIRVGLIVFMAVMTVALIAIFLWHLAMPGELRWLSAAEIENIKGLAITLIVGLFMSGVTAYFFKKKL